MLYKELISNCEGIKMKFRTKIKLSFIVLAFIPVFAITTLLLYVGKTQLRLLEKKYGIEDIGIESISNPTRIYSEITQNVYNEIIAAISDNVNRLEDMETLEQLNNKLGKKFSFLVVKKSGIVVYNGSGEDNEEISKLPDYREESYHLKENVVSSYIYGDYQYLIKQLDFEYSDGENGSIYLMTGLEKIVPHVKRLCLELICSILGIIFITAMVLTVWIYRSMMRPIRKLTDATKRIAEGDLDFTIETNDRDEFGELCQDFEVMRKRLKESAEDKLRDDVESKELISNISHDLKTPITAIKGYVEGLMDGVADTPEKMERYIKTIYNKANDMDRLIGELTVYSKIDTNRIPFNFEKVNVDEYFSDCVDEISIELESRNIRLNYFNYVDKNTLIIADVEQMKRVINNIVSNSVKYIGNKQGALNIRINDDNDFIHIEIEDNGKGIDNKDLPYVFDRFYRTDASRNSNQGGSGIGLSIVKKIIEVHGGKIWATSKLDTGTIMHFIVRKYVEPEADVNGKDINH